jgi:hypothetical protein
MRLGPDRHALFDLEIEKQLIGIKLVAEISKRRPLHAAFRRRSPISIEDQFAVFGTDVQFIVVGIKQFDPVLRAFRKRNAVPHLLTRAIRARFALAGPSGNLEFGSARRQPRIVQTVFDLVH